ncbi:ABC transporter ATP-binding protein [Alloyangia pacifica]|uniref:Flagellar assembly protein FliH n=1 Tax=Alloyangia pacifica TaxID=311180 RepID=A0A1I6VBY8_9RHOB|nr:ABC transporter ATP-binding protein [Alloyangia pacifica]SDH84367.1 flagellar assembly protein FliH [Alloyangia pacifica]SFT11189.1 flagellar assembly protein FliH [Alloyangia pacifica]
MSDLHDFLEDFAARPSGTAAPAPEFGEAEVEAGKLESFDTGYRAGWDDAIKAQAEETHRIASDFAQNLQDLSFTYNEAYRQVLDGVSPLLEGILQALLPTLLHETLGLHLHEQLAGMAQEIARREVLIAVAPESAAQVTPLLEQDFGFPLRLEEDPTLAEGQADLRFGETEKQIDLSGLLDEVTRAVEGFAHDNRRNAAHG